MNIDLSFSKNKYPYWTVLTYFVVKILVRLELEYSYMKYGDHVNLITIHFNTFGIFFFIYAFIAFSVSIFKVNLGAATIYFIPLFYAYLLVNNRSDIIEFEAVLKSYIFNYIPEICSKEVNSHVRICPIYYYNDARYFWIIDNSNKISLPLIEWPNEMRESLGVLSSCELNSIRKIIKNVYYFHGGCVEY